MATIKPFKAIRPKKELAKNVAAFPYDILTSDEAREITKENPYSFLHVDKAEIDLDKNINIYDKSVYLKAKENLNNMIKSNVLFQDSKDMFYIYRIGMNNIEQTGLVVCTNIDEYLDGTIKKHELTREDKEIDRINHVDYCNANTGPIFLTYQYQKEISDIIDKWANSHTAEYDFISDDENTQKVWIIYDDNTIKNLIELFKNVPNLYIADGHHRNASAVKVGLKRRKEKADYNGKEEFNFYLSVLFPSNELRIFDYNRVVKDLNNLTEDEFFKKLEEKFVINEYNGQGGFKPKKQHQFGLYINNKWYCMDIKPEFIPNNILEALDVSILEREVLIPILNIGDVRKSSRIDFVGGIRGLTELEKRVNSGEMKLAFSMYPTSISELMKVADMGEIMPPKSTWFEPKLKSGLFIHLLE